MKLMPLIASSALCLYGATATAGGGPLDISSGSAGFSDTPVVGSFVDVYTFTLTSDAIVNASVTSVVNGAQDIDFSSLTVAGPGGSFSFTQLLGDPVETWALAATPLSAGSYTLSVEGMNSPAAASYGGNIAVSIVGTVPEPATAVLLLAGFGAFGWVVRRRQI